MATDRDHDRRRICTLIYGTVQQNYRESLNDPQIQMAEDKAYDLGTTAHPNPATILPASTVDNLRRVSHRGLH